MSQRQGKTREWHCSSISSASPGNIDKDAHYQKLIRDLIGLNDKRFHAYMRLVDFEYYLVKCGYIKDSDEVDEILNKCVLFPEWE